MRETAVAKILIVDDDIEYSKTLCGLLEPHGWIAEAASTGHDATQLLENFSYDFILLDWNLPDMTGLAICKKYRASGGKSPIIFLTGRDGVEDKEAGLDAGGDDYLTKPFDVRELLARIRSVQRRQTLSVSQKFVLNGIEFDPKMRSLKAVGELVTLSPTESALLEFLFRHPNKLHSSARLFEAVWPSESDSSGETVRVHMRILRKKLSIVGGDAIIKTVRPSGYVIEIDTKE